MTWTAASLASRIGAVVEGAGDRSVSGLAGLAEAGGADVSFLANPRYEHLMAHTAAAAVVVAGDWRGAWSCGALIRAQDPDEAFARIAGLLAPPPVVRAPGIHPTAFVAPTARLGRDVHIGAYTVIEDDACIGDRCVIECQCFVGRDVALGDDAHLYPQVCIRERCRIGRRFAAHCGVVIGSDGFGYHVGMSQGRPVVTKIPQLGIVEIGDDVEIGANTTIDRARFGRTRLGNHVKVDNLVQLGHNVVIGDLCGIMAQAGVAGSTRVGSGVRLWAQAGVSGHLAIHDGAQIGPQAGVTKDVPAGEYVIGSPAVTKREAAFRLLLSRHVEKLKARVAELESRLAALEAARP